MDVFLGFITPFPYTYAPYGWHLSDGSQVQIPQNQALYALLGTTFGGNGTTYFNLPDLQGRTVVGMYANNAPPYNLGNAGGSSTVTLTADQVPAPTINIAKGAGNNAAPDNGAYLASQVTVSGRPDPMFITGAPSAGTFTLGGVSGGGNPVNIQNPFLALRYCIAMQGLFPARS